MKVTVQLLTIFLLGFVMLSCSKDNFTDPKSTLTGQIVYNGEPIGVEFNQVRLQLWQPGFGKLAPIDAPVDQDGSYSALLFNGNYKLVVPSGRGPFRTIQQDASKKDTLYVALSGNQTLDVEVQPYYMIRNASFNGGEGKVAASLKLEKIIIGVNAKDVESVSLFINKTNFVSRATNIGVVDLNAADLKDLNSISLTVNVPALVPAQDYVFGRVGVKIKDVEDMVFSPVQKIDL
ncbi:hypothetical protein DYBT9623_05136 [Dyadobacter sp. CECT 9623]|uniref:DUF3823 domain-containing protein n=1 Tax=Dyadobacter linearis TaxID=2823330 RepID=A0ABM8UXY4_9BACT|nr:DUF3823 domain-containing protein [Dyadobacter sp. CECT 9623]CAG5074449.1 hypothetical protein DYBT9623_05136 [Dyadobacter sp. CECT 9623]